MNQPFDWSICVSALTGEHLKKLAAWRGYSMEFCEHLHSQGLIGLHDGHIAFPVHDQNGDVISCHYRVHNKRTQQGQWFFFPTGIGNRPLILGHPERAATVLVFEGQWDCFAILDKLGWHSSRSLPDTAAVAIRGASNGAVMAGLCSREAIVYAFRQNDPPRQNGKPPAADVWLADVARTCGCKCLHVQTPPGHEDPNAWTKAGASAPDIWKAILAAKPVLPANQQGDFSDLQDSEPPKEGDPSEFSFPLESLPPILRAIVGEAARVERNPPILAACAALAAVSTAIGSGLELPSGPNKKVSGNLYILATAPSGSGKSRAFDIICRPLIDWQNEQIMHWRKKVGPGLRADIAILKQRIKQLENDAGKAESDAERAELRARLEYPLAQLDEIRKKLALPRLYTEDVTVEALAGLLGQNHEAISSLSADARKVTDNLLGRMNPNKKVDDSLYLKGWSRDPCTVDRKDKAPTILNAPCIAIFWLIQPDILEELFAERSLLIGGFLPRACICHTHTKRRKIEGTVETISAQALADWDRLIADLLTAYHKPGSRYVAPVSEAAMQRLNDHYNRTVDLGEGELADVESFVARWTGQAWHLAVVLHAGRWGNDAHNRPLSSETAEAAIEIADWFARQQLDVLERGRQETRQKLEDSVLALLDERWERLKQDFVTARLILQRHITRTSQEAQALLARMLADGILECEEVRRPEGGHVERRFRRKFGRNPVPG